MHDPESSFGLAQLCDTEALPRAGYSGLHGVRDLSNIVAHCYNEPTLKTLYVIVKWQGITGSATLAISSCILKEVQREQIPHSTYWLTVKLVLLLLSAAGFNLSKPCMSTISISKHFVNNSNPDALARSHYSSPPMHRRTICIHNSPDVSRTS